jgi:hypothetical protein
VREHAGRVPGAPAAKRTPTPRAASRRAGCAGPPARRRGPVRVPLLGRRPLGGGAAVPWSFGGRGRVAPFLRRAAGRSGWWRSADGGGAPLGAAVYGASGPARPRFDSAERARSSGLAPPVMWSRPRPGRGPDHVRVREAAVTVYDQIPAPFPRTARQCKQISPLSSRRPPSG